MITITDYILNIYKDFKKFIENQDDDLCELLKFTYQAGQLPNYNSKYIQQLYLLRYAFAYAFEYKNMFEDLFEKEQFYDKIKVVSIGCGNMIDYWSLVKAIEEENYKCNIDYIGIDRIDWIHKIKGRTCDRCKFELEDVILFFDKMQTLDANVYIFPKSISEFSDKEFKHICDNFKKKEILNDRIHILISLRSDEGSMERDMKKSEKIISAICKNGFLTEDESTEYIYLNGKGIKGHDPQFDYPDEAKRLLFSLDQKCYNYDKCRFADTEFCEPSNWKPTLTVNKMRYQILTFDRED